MGVKADELMALREEGEERRVAELFNDANCKTYSFRCKAKMDTFGETQRVRYQVQAAKPIDFASESRKLAELIKQYNIGSDSVFIQ